MLRPSQPVERPGAGRSYQESARRMLMTMIHVPGRPAGRCRLLALLLCFLGPWGAIAAGARAADPVRNDQLPIAPGPFQPTKTSLKTYQYPEWFRDAKL